MENFLRGHVGALRVQGVPRVLLYDNLKSAVLNGAARRSASIHAAELRRRLSLRTRPVAVARGNEKGRVERAIPTSGFFLRGSRLHGC